MATTRQARYADGYIERREVLLDGSLLQGERDAGKPTKTMYFASVEDWYGNLRNTEAEAVTDGRAYCARTNLHVPCFG